MTSQAEPSRVDASAAAEGEQLRRIQIVTDASLAHLELDELLDTLLERARAILDADTAAILLMDRTTQEMVATAAKGLEEEVRSGVRIPVGRGFAGRVATERKPVILDHVDHTNVLNPILVEVGIRSLLGVPLIANGDTIGVLHVGTLRSRTFSAEDAEVLQLVADRAALAIDAGVVKQERTAAKALQRGLLPRLPRIDRLEIAARYLPAHARVVSGDWYDVFELPSGHVGAAIGDVVGQGLRSAIVMGRIRSALRAYALESYDPAAVLTRLDEMVCHFEAEEIATLLYAVIDPRRRQMTFSSAGHFPPVVAPRSGKAHIMDMRSDPPVGAGVATTRRRDVLEVHDGTTLYFFTDGVVERRGEDIDVGLARLCNAATAGSPHRGCMRIVSELGDTQLEDDFAVLALHVRSS
jgi:sigma-B regulation protein RsbU (phosphoserine phosphatase)